MLVYRKKLANRLYQHKQSKWVLLCDESEELIWPIRKSRQTQYSKPSLELTDISDQPSALRC